MPGGSEVHHVAERSEHECGRRNVRRGLAGIEANEVLHSEVPRAGRNESGGRVEFRQPAPRTVDDVLVPAQSRLGAVAESPGDRLVPDVNGRHRCVADGPDRRMFQNGSLDGVGKPDGLDRDFARLDMRPRSVVHTAKNLQPRAVLRGRRLVRGSSRCHRIRCERSSTWPRMKSRARLANAGCRHGWRTGMDWTSRAMQLMDRSTGESSA